MQPGDLLLRPPVFIAVTLVVINDQLLKERYGNWLTGKLSDVAGVFVLPLVMLSALELARWARGRSGATVSRHEVLLAIAITLIGFTLVKLVGPVGDAYAHAIGWIRAIVASAAQGEWRPATPIEVIRDWTDLLVLPVLAASWLLARDRGDRPITSATTP